MKLGAFRTYMREFVRTDAQPYVTAFPTEDATGLKALINRCLVELSESCYFLYGRGVSMGTLTGQTLDVRSLGTKVIWPVQLVVAGTLLRDVADRPGPVTLAEMQANPDYVTGTAGTPTMWTRLQGSTVAFDKAPSALGGTNTVDGFTEHPAVSDDTNDEIQIPDGFERAAAQYCAAALLEPRAGGQSREKMVSLYAACLPSLQALASRALMVDPFCRPPMLGMSAAGLADKDGDGS